MCVTPSLRVFGTKYVHIYFFFKIQN